MFERPKNNDPTSRTSRFRRRRFRIVEGLLDRIISVKGRAAVLDVGGRRDYWNLLDKRFHSTIALTLLNLPSELEVGREQASEDPLKVDYLAGDGCSMPQYGDRSFDLVHANSVIEHVGSLQNMQRLADEIRRVGNAYYVQTPYLWFPLEPHYGVPFVHWLPGPTRAQLLNRYAIGYTPRIPRYPDALAAADETQLVDKTLMRKLFPDAAVQAERFAFMTKSLIAVREPALDAGSASTRPAAGS